MYKLVTVPKAQFDVATFVQIVPESRVVQEKYLH